MKYFRKLIVSLALACVPWAMAQAQAVPSGSIRIIVPAAAGGASDIAVRMIGERLQRAMGQPVIIDNRPGADGILAAQAAAQAPADGQTLFFGITSTHVSNVVLRRKLPYDPARDFAPVTLLGTTALVLLVNPNLPVKSAAELVAYAKANPGKLAVASSYVSARMAGELFKQVARVDMLHVPYKGTVAALTDLIGGQVQVMFGDLASAMPHVQSGKLRALAVTSAHRTLAAPQLPTVAESGLPGYEMTGWGGFFVPARTPAAAVARLNAELVAIIASPEVRQRMLESATEVAPGTPAALGSMIAADVEKWRNLAELAHVEVTD
ncbi:MAG: tripartite tricarboxylate transporter substrate binding protein [Sulfuricaulis sp.]|nr:tripartite tricarboxylate transporter substrate binding protein [Sulfuricaulis sp.]